MKPPAIRSGAVEMFLLASVALSGVMALGAPATGQGTEHNGKEKDSALAERQEIVKDRVGRLEDRMYQLSQALRQSEPDKAARLLEGLGELRGKQIREQLDAIIAKLRDRRFSDAADAQQAVEADLQALLKLLLEDPDNLDDRREEIERLEEIRRTLEKLIAELEKEKANAEAARVARQHAEDLEAAAMELRKLIPRQQELAEETRAGDGTPSDLAERQETLRGETEALSQDVSAILEALEADRAEAREQPSAGSESPPDPTGELKDAARDMEAAERALRDDQRDRAAPRQKDASKKLEEALEKIESRAKDLRDRLDLDNQSAEQQETAEKGKRLLDDMRGDQQPKPGGEQQQGESQQGNQPQGKQDGQSSEPTPGQSGVEQAIPFQEEAADELKDEELNEAIEQQEQALEKLKQAKDEMEDRLDQLRKEQQEELLARLESRFRAMLARQTECNKATNRLAELGAENWTRSDQLEFADLSQKQRWVADQADEALFLLVEEGSTLVLPQLVEQVRDDGRDAADRLAAADAGPTVLMLQNELEQLLKDILEAIKRKQEKMQNQGGGGGGGGNSPLLPGSAELKLLRSCQLRVNGATQKLEESRGASAAVDAEIDAALGRLSKRQADVAEMAKHMHEALRQSQ